MYERERERSDICVCVHACVYLCICQSKTPGHKELLQCVNMAMVLCDGMFIEKGSLI